MHAPCNNMSEDPVSRERTQSMSNQRSFDSKEDIFCMYTVLASGFLFQWYNMILVYLTLFHMMWFQYIWKTFVSLLQISITNFPIFHVLQVVGSAWHVDDVAACPPGVAQVVKDLCRLGLTSFRQTAVIRWMVHTRDLCVFIPSLGLNQCTHHLSPRHALRLVLLLCSGICMWPAGDPPK